MLNGTVSIGSQSFEKLRINHSFYIDKTAFIKEWWENQDDVSLITRPRRFGKTLNLSMLECFFSVNYAGRVDLFEGLDIWEDEAYRSLQGTYPLISLSFANVKDTSYENARQKICQLIAEEYAKYRFLPEGSCLTEMEKKAFLRIDMYMGDVDAALALNQLSGYLYRYYGKKVIFLLDEYDTPLQEAYVYGYWDQLVEFVRSLFNATFKTNPYLERAVMTGITRVSKESIFSDLNNLAVATVTSEKYRTAFGFTEDEVLHALDTRGLYAEKDNIKFWYDGFIFGGRADIYNPWSITVFLDSGEYGAHWAGTSSNRMVSELIREGSPELKMQMEELLAGNSLKIPLDEQIVFDQLKKTQGAIWSMLMASGYLKPVNRTFDIASGKYIYELMITNHEVKVMFRNMIAEWFPEDLTAYGDFKKALLAGDLDYMNQFMNEISMEMFSSFDVGSKPSEETHPERFHGVEAFTKSLEKPNSSACFYHGFVLGLIVDLSNRYQIRSNRESGFGRYDVMLEPKKASDDAIIMEFKVFHAKKDKTLESAVQNALKQIDDMSYDADLTARGISKERIRHYGFAFEGKKVLIGEG